MLKEFRDFLLRGNLLELAVAFVMGLAFAALVTSFVDDLLMPIVAMIFGKPDFSDLTFTINDAVFRYGAFLTALITFLTTAAAIFFFVVEPMNAIMARMSEARRGRGHRTRSGGTRSSSRRSGLGRRPSLDDGLRSVLEEAAEALVQEDEADLVEARLERARRRHGDRRRSSGG